MIEVVKLSQKAENQFCRHESRIMDQFDVGMGQKDCATITK